MCRHSAGSRVVGSFCRRGAGSRSWVVAMLQSVQNFEVTGLQPVEHAKKMSVPQYKARLRARFVSLYRMFNAEALKPRRWPRRKCTIRNSKRSPEKFVATYRHL